MHRHHFYSDMFDSVMDKICYAVTLLGTMKSGQRETYWD